MNLAQADRSSGHRGQGSPGKRRATPPFASAQKVGFEDWRTTIEGSVDRPGAPLRLRLEHQIGYKSMKHLRKIVVLDHLDDPDGSHIRYGWSWYNSI